MFHERIGKVKKTLLSFQQSYWNVKKKKKCVEMEVYQDEGQKGIC